ncbi:hypothetical protein OAK47_00155 [Planctomycetaceae bacterium]|jgi:hypothetical protein|nr:hypothetical protein [Planctomycetaceae bacterium]MDC0261608.1 hypothetical protein [Planctomycetaceae bacterium]
MSQDRPESGSPAPGEFLIETDSPAITKKIRRKKTPFWRSPLMVIFVILLGAGGGLFYVWQQQQSSQGMMLTEIEDKTVEELSELSFKLPFSDDSVDLESLQISLVRAPEGAVIDPKTGVFQWTPSEEVGPAELEIGVEARPRTNPENVSRQLFKVVVTEKLTTPEIEYIDPQNVRADVLTRIPINVTDPDVPASEYRFELVGDVAEGAKIDADFGTFSWKPAEELVNRTVDFEVKVSEVDHPELSATRKFQLKVKSYDPVKKLNDLLADGGVDLEYLGREPEGPFRGKGQVMRAGRNRLDVYTYASKEAADEDAKLIAADLSKMFDVSDPFTVPTKIYRDDRLLVVAAGVQNGLHFRLSFVLGTAIASTNDFDSSAVASNTPPSKIDEATENMMQKEEDQKDPLGDQQLETHYTEKTLFNKRNYDEIRKIYSNRFEIHFKDSIESAFGVDLEKVNAWFDEHIEIKEELYTAINPAYDNSAEALRVFYQLWKDNPDRVAEYGALAIATSVVWDLPERGVYDYTRHQQRTHSNMPDELLESSVENFNYLIENEKFMQGRAQLVPWEFMVHLVNHKTPTNERGWALQNYLPKREMFGSCYADVPYDNLMLETQSQDCKLEGEDYSLVNLRSIGGVCAMQADFAARVGKSMGVPAEYVRGESAFGDYHAWVMWIELKALTKNGINFSLESYGRYRGDKYYVGTLQDPQTGTIITDRELELRLHTVGLDPISKRLADHAMTAYPFLKEKRKFSLDEQLDYLLTVVEVSPGNENAWLEIAEISNSGNLEKTHMRQMRKTLDMLFSTFSNFPDFTWKVFDKLIQYEEDLKDQIDLYNRLIQLYVSAGRPDLSSEARMMMTGYLIDGNRVLDAVEGLAATIMAFPEEGRYVPKMLDRLEVLVNTNPNYSRHLLSFYKAFLPRVPPRRGDSPSKYCMKMYERGIQRFELAGDNTEANRYKALLGKLQGT